IPRVVAADTPTITYPAWLMDEYASMRFTSLCTMATVAPTSMVTTATLHTTGCQLRRSLCSATTKTRKIAENPAALAPAAMNPVTGVGAPWYTSGVHMWNGTAATLKPRPTASNAIAVNIRRASAVAAAREIAEMFVVLTAPYVSAIP